MSHRKRIQSALWMIPLAIAAIWFLPTQWMAAFMALLLLAGLYEWCALAHLDATLSRWGYLAVNAAVLAVIAWTDDATHRNLRIVSLIGGAFWLLVPLWLWRFDFARTASSGHRRLKLLAGSLACIPAWAALVWIHGGPNGAGWTLFAIALIAAADSGAYVFGVNFGNHKLAPHISPGKSWEGFWGGLFVTLLIAVTCMPLFGAALSDLWRYALLGLLTALFSVIGDLFESLMKRHACIKDSSTLIPGHGGLFDRLDSIVSGLVIFALVKYGLAL